MVQRLHIPKIFVQGYLFVAAVLVAFFVSTPLVAAASDWTWTEQSDASAIKNWGVGISVSSDSKHIAALASDELYTSVDAGKTWTHQAGASGLGLVRLAGSSDNKHLVGAPFGDTLYTSIDYGTTWTGLAGSGVRDWYGVDMSANGKYLVGGVWGGYLYTSSDFGVSWAEHQLGGTPDQWSDVAMSSDGKYMYATSSNGLWKSSDHGVNWVFEASTTSWTPSMITTSADGKFVAGGNFAYNRIYTSNDYGVTWTEQLGSGQNFWVDIASSASGAYLITSTLTNGQGFFVSRDYGVTWAEQGIVAGRHYGGIGASGDGSLMVALLTGAGGYIVTGYDPSLIVAPAATTTSGASPAALPPSTGYGPEPNQSLLPASIVVALAAALGISLRRYEKTAK